MQFLYEQGLNIIFMNNHTFEQIQVPKKQIAWELNFIKESSICEVRMYENEILGIELSPKVNLKVIEAEPAVKGDSVTNLQIKVKLETGFELYVPAFIKKNEIIAISTSDGSYSGRGH